MTEHFKKLTPAVQGGLAHYRIGSGQYRLNGRFRGLLRHRLVWLRRRRLLGTWTAPAVPALWLAAARGPAWVKTKLQLTPQSWNADEISSCSPCVRCGSLFSTSASAVANIPSPSRAFPPGQPQLAVSRSLPSKLGTKLSKRGIVTRVRGILLTEASAKIGAGPISPIVAESGAEVIPGRQQNLMPGPFRVSFFQKRGHAFTKVLRRADAHILFHRRDQLPIQLFAGVSPQQPLRRLQAMWDSSSAACRPARGHAPSACRP